MDIVGSVDLVEEHGCWIVVKTWVWNVPTYDFEVDVHAVLWSLDFPLGVMDQLEVTNVGPLVLGVVDDHLGEVCEN